MKERFIYIVRHGERKDNIDPLWRTTAVRWDDPPLSDRGHKQAREVAERLKHVAIDHVYVSPLTRTIQTAKAILDARKEGHPRRMCLEPGFIESLNACASPPGVPSREEQSRLSPYIDHSYSPEFSLHQLDAEDGDHACYNRISATLSRILRRTRGNILIVSHGSPIAASHLFLFSRWAYVGQCTVSKTVQCGSSFAPVSIGDKSHLSQHTHLHERQSKKGEEEKAKMLEKRIREEREAEAAKQKAAAAVVQQKENEEIKAE